jgi:adenylate kinase family enzyme
MLGFKCKGNWPKRQPRVIVIGAPGSGRSSQARIIAQKFGLVHVNTSEILNEEI